MRYFFLSILAGLLVIIAVPYVQRLLKPLIKKIRKPYEETLVDEDEGEDKDV